MFQLDYPRYNKVVMELWVVTVQLLCVVFFWVPMRTIQDELDDGKIDWNLLYYQEIHYGFLYILL